MWLDKGDFPKNMYTVCVCVKINKHSFEPFLCLDKNKHESTETAETHFTISNIGVFELMIHNSFI